MGNLANWTDKGQQERDSLNFVIDDEAVSVDVFRRSQQAGVAGLTSEIHDVQFLRTIYVRFDSYRSRSTAAGSARISDTPIGLTNNTDVQPGDLWRWTDVANRTRWYRVTASRRTQSTSSVVLEDIKR